MSRPGERNVWQITGLFLVADTHQDLYATMSCILIHSFRNSTHQSSCFVIDSCVFFFLQSNIFCFLCYARLLNWGTVILQSKVFAALTCTQAAGLQWHGMKSIVLPATIGFFSYLQVVPVVYKAFENLLYKILHCKGFAA